MAGNAPGNGRRNYPPAIKPPMRITGRFYTTDEAAEILDVSKQRITVFLGEGRLTGFMFSNVWFIAGCSVERLLEHRERGEMHLLLAEGVGREEVTG